MGMKCPKCHFDNPSDSKFCKKCSAPLKSSENISVSETKTLQTPVDRSQVIDLEPGEVIEEKYRLVEELGSGGMGVVYKAEQIEPVKRYVALKIIKLGMDTKEVVNRFENEKQALAVMKHHNIAKVHDAGATRSGRPYFVMELVGGIPITDYCDKHKLTTTERLELFIPVCEAVQHAHQKGVIHRDLKPSNVLVEIQENKPVPKIIDFGIAKATEQRLAEKTLFTKQGQLIGTPEYMSPEQAEMSGLDVDTRTDIYSLGVMFYELLVGILPFDSEALRSARFSETQKIIRDEEPPRASTRLSELGDTQILIAEKRRTDISSLLKQLKGDLDWITMMAMEKDRTRRYSTASDLAADITRHLEKEPIIARPPSNIYNIGKFVRRHKVGVIAATFVILTVLIGGITAAIGFVRATRAERLAKQEIETTKLVSDFLVDIFKVSDPSEARGNTITAREILDKGSEKIEETLKDKPDIQTRLMETIGRVYTSLGLYDMAEPLLEKTVKTQRVLLGENHPETLTYILNLANLYWYQNRYKDAEPLYIQVAETRTRVLGENHPDTLKANFELASLYLTQRRYDEYEKLAMKTLESQRQVLGDEHPDTLDSLHNLASLYWRQGRYEEAETLNVKILEIMIRVEGEDHPETLSTMYNLATTYDKMKRYDEAEELFIKVIEAERRVRGNIHPSLMISIQRLALMYQKQGLYNKAEAQLLAAFKILAAKLGNKHEQTQVVIKRLIDIYEAWGKMDKSAEYRALLIENEREK